MYSCYTYGKKIEYRDIKQALGIPPFLQIGYSSKPCKVNSGIHT